LDDDFLLRGKNDELDGMSLHGGLSELQCGSAVIVQPSLIRLCLTAS
jgi:hypothetical protein